MGSFYNAFYKAFVIKPFSKTLLCFNIYFSCIYNRCFVDIKEMPTSEILQGRCVEPGVSFHERNKFFLVGFSLTFTRFLQNTKNGLNTSLWTLRFLTNILIKEPTFFPAFNYDRLFFCSQLENQNKKRLLTKTH